MKRIAVSEFDLRHTLESGQVFHWDRDGKGWRGLVDHTNVYVEQDGTYLRCAAAHAPLVSRYFALDHPLEEIYASFPDHDYMRAARRFCGGIRIIRQPRWECVATFITSPMKQVTHIRQMSLAIRKRFGKPVSGSAVFAYPGVEKLAPANEQALRECGLGFRAKNLLLSARKIAEGEIDLEHIATLPTSEAREMLCKLPGVGKKVANCILLFTYERLDAVPIDVWIDRVLREVFLSGRRKVNARRVEEFSQTQLGVYAGYAQQYLFHYARNLKMAAA